MGMRGDSFMWDELHEKCVGESLYFDGDGAVMIVRDHLKPLPSKP